MHAAWKKLSAAAVSAVAVVAAVTAVGTASAAAKEPDPVIGRPVFNDPTGDQSVQYAIYQQLARLIDRVPAGADIEMSWFEVNTQNYADTPTRPNIVERLRRAKERGANVRILLDNNDKENNAPRNEQHWPYQELKKILGDTEAADSHILLCARNKGCLAKRTLVFSASTLNAYNHNKFLTASRVVLNDGSEQTDVVFQASANLTSWDADSAFNNAMTWSDPNSYSMYRQYFTDLRANRNGKGNDNYYRVGNSADEYKVHLFPRKETVEGQYNQASSDPIVSILNSVTCTYESQFDGSTRHTAVRIAMWSFNRVAVAQKLVALIKAGCRVEVVYSKTNADTAKVLNSVKDSFRLIPCYGKYQGRNLRVHSKYMLIDGRYDDDEIPRVYLGSHNFSISALRNADESMVRVRSAATHERYLQDNFVKVRDTCSQTTPPAAAAATVLDNATSIAQEAGTG